MHQDASGAMPFQMNLSAMGGWGDARVKQQRPKPQIPG